MLDLLLTDGGGTATTLSERLPVTRQAVAKHLGVLDRVGLVHVTPSGRERRYEVDEAQLARAVAQLASVGADVGRPAATASSGSPRRSSAARTPDPPHTQRRHEGGGAHEPRPEPGATQGKRYRDGGHPAQGRRHGVAGGGVRRPDDDRRDWPAGGPRTRPRATPERSAGSSGSASPAPGAAASTCWSATCGPASACSGRSSRDPRSGSAPRSASSCPRRTDFTIVMFAHTGWREPCAFMNHCSTKWATFLMSLKQLVETGSGAAGAARRPGQQLALRGP